MGLNWGGVIAVVGPCVNRSAIICIFVLLSVYSWLLIFSSGGESWAGL